MLQYSDNNGATWSPATKLNDDLTTNSQYDPAIALDQSSGNVAVSWYGTRTDLGTGGNGDTDGSGMTTSRSGPPIPQTAARRSRRSSR